MSNSEINARNVAVKLLESAPSAVLSAVVYGVPIVYAAGIVVEFLYQTFTPKPPPRHGLPAVTSKNSQGVPK